MEFDFDTVRTNSHLNILKALLPFLDREAQKFLSIYILIQELMLTISFFRDQSHHFSYYDNISCFYDRIIDQLPQEQRDKVSQMKSMMEAFEMMNAYQSMMNFDTEEEQKDTPEEERNPDFSGQTPVSQTESPDFLMGFLTDEQKAMFDMFQSTLNGKDS